MCLRRAPEKYINGRHGARGRWVGQGCIACCFLYTAKDISAPLTLLFRNLHQEITDLLLRLTGFPAKSRTENLPNINAECYRYANPPDRKDEVSK
jgi:hypothetical protein